MPESAKWTVREGTLALMAPGGVILPATAMEIFQVEFGGARRIQGLEVNKPSADLSGTILSRFPAEPAVSVADGAYGLNVRLGVWVDGEFVELERDTDQLIAGRKWYPIAPSAVTQAREWLREIAGTDVRNAPLRLLVALRSRGDFPGRVIDEVKGDSLALTSKRALVSGPILGLEAELYAYQTQGVGFLKEIARQGIGCILGDEMGLGKTLQVIALLVDEANQNRKPSLVVAPATLLENWRRELNVFAPRLSVIVHAGSGRPGLARQLRSADVTIVSYETAVRDEPLLGAVEWNILALDEAQNIKNPEALRTQAAKRLPRRVSIAVTGTPLENHLEDLWSITDFAVPGMLGELDAFRKRFAEDLHDAGRLGAVVAPILLRRRVAQVAQDLPPKIVIPQALQMPTALAEQYEQVRKETLHEYGAAANLVATAKLRMFCTDPALVLTLGQVEGKDTPKIERLMEILDEVFAAQEKCLVFCSYTDAADRIASRVSREHPDAFISRIDGRVAVTGRQPIVDDFFAFSGPGVLVLNPKAAGVGLNITAANHVIHFNPEWNPALTDQATARAYRRKQSRPVTVHNMYYVDTIEDVIVSRAEFKRELAGQAVTGHEGDASLSDIARALSISPVRQDSGV